MSKRITSANNKEIKYLNKLLIKSSFRKKEKKFVVEGKREIIMAVENGFKINKVIIRIKEVVKCPIKITIFFRTLTKNVFVVRKVLAYLLKFAEDNISYGFDNIME